MKINNLEELLPQSPPILMLDRAIDVMPNQSGTGVRTFQEDDPCFQGHFPGNPILPGVLIIEALAQTAMAVMLADPVKTDGNNSGYLVKIDKASFYQSITPGDTVHFHIQIGKKINRFIMASGTVERNGEAIGKANLTLAMG